MIALALGGVSCITSCRRYRGLRARAIEIAFGSDDGRYRFENRALRTGLFHTDLYLYLNLHLHLHLNLSLGFSLSLNLIPELRRLGSGAVLSTRQGPPTRRQKGRRERGLRGRGRGRRTRARRVAPLIAPALWDPRRVPCGTPDGHARQAG